MPVYPQDPDTSKVHHIPEWPRPGQMAVAWGLFSPGHWGAYWLDGLYERYKDAKEDATGSFTIREVEVIFGLDEKWHAVRHRFGEPQPRTQSKKAEEREVACRASARRDAMSVLNGPGEGTWSVYAGELQAKLDAAEAKVERLTHELEEARDERDGALIKESWAVQVERDLTTLRAEVEALKGQVYIGEHEFPDLTWKARCEETVSDLRASRAESDYLRAVVQNAADEPCRKLLLYHDTTCPEEYADRTKWCLACRARVALEEMRSHEAR
jgi:hypothetical protein